MDVILRDLQPFDKKAVDKAIERDHGLHPYDKYLKPGRIPHIWCPGCGLGVVLTCFIEAVMRKGYTCRRVRSGVRYRLHRSGSRVR